MPSPSFPRLKSGQELAQRLMGVLRDSHFLPTIYPALFHGGIDEGSLHAYVLSALVLVGDRLDLSPVCDSPIFDRLDKLLTGEGAKRPDAVWFARGTQEIRCLIEFERYSSHSLSPKAHNLLIMGKEHGETVELAVLWYWTYTRVPDANLRAIGGIFAQGFRHQEGIVFPPLSCPALVLELIVEEKLATNRTAITDIWPRLFVAGGENKPYLVDQLNSGYV